jgi:hypothetical protein
MKESKNVLEEVEYLCFLCTSQRCGKIHILNTSTQMKAGEIVSSHETFAADFGFMEVTGYREKRSS